VSRVVPESAARIRSLEIAGDGFFFRNMHEFCTQVPEN
jgi:hypothetical protein